MAGTDPVDTHGHDEDDAKAQSPNFDAGEDPASKTTPSGDNNLTVRAQSAAEVTAQEVNAVGES